MKFLSRRCSDLLPFLFAGVLASCNAPVPAHGTGGTDEPPGVCGRGVVVVSSDYQSTNVSLLAFDGRVLSSSLISSATASSALSAPLSGDVVMPSEMAAGEEIVLIDRSTSVLSWVNVRSSAVRAQLSIAGYKSNPHDYVQLAEHKAYVTRYEPNLQAQRANGDAGSDIAVLDPGRPALIGRVPLDTAMQDEDARFLPHPDRAVQARAGVYALLTGYTLFFEDSAESRLIEIDAERDELRSVHVLEGLHGCWGLALAPSGDEVAVACSGGFRGASSSERAESGVAVLRLGPPVEELARFSPAELGPGSVGDGISYASERTLVVTTLGSFDEGLDDTVVEIDLDSRESRTLLRSAGVPFTLGAVRCASSCQVCFVTDAQRGVVQRFEVGQGGTLVSTSAIVVDTSIGLPPRYLGGF